jgi:hypothetical protein
MNFKSFNIHHFNNGNIAHKLKYRGFTAIVSPGKGERDVDVQLVFCSKQDMYCRKTGVEKAMDRESAGTVFTCNARDLLDELDYAAQSYKCEKVDHNGTHILDKQFLYKYLF